MRTVTHREMRNASGEILRAVAAGESVQITNNGQVAAVISPPGDALARLVALGQARPARQPLDSIATISRVTSAVTSDALLESARGRW